MTLRVSIAIAAGTIAAAVVAATFFGGAPSTAQDIDEAIEAATGNERAMARPALLVPVVDSARGRRLFVNKGCVLCHSVNGVGGRAATAFDATPGDMLINPFDFMARMWRGAAQMLALQSMELGYQIELSGDELADIIGFVSNAEAQAGFSLDEVPEAMHGWVVDEPLGPFEVPMPEDSEEDGFPED
jgi:cytochrome c